MQGFKEDNFFKDNDVSLSLEESFQKHGGKGQDDDFGGLLADPDDQNQQITGREENNEEEQDGVQGEENPLDQAIDEQQLISEEEASQVKLNDQKILDQLEEVQQDDGQQNPQMSFLKEFEQFNNDKPSNGNSTNHNSGQRHTNGKRQPNDLVIEESTSIKSNFMCCIIEQSQDNGNSDEPHQQRLRLNCLIF